MASTSNRQDANPPAPTSPHGKRTWLLVAGILFAGLVLLLGNSLLGTGDGRTDNGAAPSADGSKAPIDPVQRHEIPVHIRNGLAQEALVGTAVKVHLLLTTPPASEELVENFTVALTLPEGAEQKNDKLTLGANQTVSASLRLPPMPSLNSALGRVGFQLRLLIKSHEATERTITVDTPFDQQILDRGVQVNLRQT